MSCPDQTRTMEANASPNAKMFEILLISSTHCYGLFHFRSNIVSVLDHLSNFVTVHDLVRSGLSDNTKTLKVSQVLII